MGNEMSRGEDTFWPKFKKILQWPLNFVRNKFKIREIHHNTIISDCKLLDTHNTVIHFRTLELSSEDIAPVSQPEIPRKIWSLEKYLENFNQAEVKSHQPVEAKNGADPSIEFDSCVESELQIMNCDQVIVSDSGKCETDFLKQDAFIFGNMMVSRYLLSKCIDLLSEIMQACEYKENEDMQNDKEIEKKIKYCVKMLNSFDIFYYEKNELSSHSSSEGSIVLWEKHAEHTNDENLTKIMSVQKSSSSKNMSPTYCDMTRLSKLRDQINTLMKTENGDCDQPIYEILNLGPNESIIYMNTNQWFGIETSDIPPLLDHLTTCSFSKVQHPKDCDLQTEYTPSTHVYESISSSYIQLKTKIVEKYKDGAELNFPQIPRVHNDTILYIDEGPTQRLFFETLTNNTQLPCKKSPGDLNQEQRMTACDLEYTTNKGKITECNICRSNNLNLNSYDFNHSMLREDPLSGLEKADPYLRVANWVMSIENHGLLEDHASLENCWKELEHKDEETGI